MAQQHWRKLPFRQYWEAVKENAIYFTQVACAVHVFQTYIAELTMCIGPSMLPTFNVSGDVVVMEHITPYRGRLCQGDVIVARSPTDHTQTVCKRILAMEGDTILVQEGRHLAEGNSVTIPKGHVWLAGDNTANSTDSRMYGPVPLVLVKGRVIYKVWPPRCIGPIPNTLEPFTPPSPLPDDPLFPDGVSVTNPEEPSIVPLHPQPPIDSLAHKYPVESEVTVTVAEDSCSSEPQSVHPRQSVHPSGSPEALTAEGAAGPLDDDDGNSKPLEGLSVDEQGQQQGAADNTLATKQAPAAVDSSESSSTTHVDVAVAEVLEVTKPDSCSFQRHTADVEKSM